MDDIIHLLPDSVANQIAAGEVVQRPASIVKEMVENAIDAGATEIQVHVTDGGKTCVQVIDNGKGMSETDARLSFERHATSKILKADDLFSLHTMGFRGEALASIAAVSQLELRTRRPDDEVGTCLRLEGSHIESQEPVACPVGSNFAVRNLFFNIPARRKFLKTVQTELSNVVSDFQRIVLVYPDIRFTLTCNGNEILNLAATSLRNRIIDVLGKKLSTDLLPVTAETSLVRVSGYVTKPESSKKRGTYQYFFVNGRFMRHPYFHSAVMHAYDNLIPAGDRVTYFIYLAVDAATIDVNVHPTKTEIKFDNEQPIWQVLTAAVREAVGRFTQVPTIDFDTADRPDIPVYLPGEKHDVPQPAVRPSNYDPFRASAAVTPHHQSDWARLYEGLETFERPQSAPHADVGSLVRPDEEIIIDSLVRGEDGTQQSLWPEMEKKDGSVLPSTIFTEIHHLPRFQYKGRFIVIPTAVGLLLVDQHRADVCVHYDDFLHRITTHSHPSQGFLFPEIVQFDTTEALTVERIFDQLTAVGFDLSNLGGGSYSVSGIPAGTEGIQPQSLLHDLVYAAMEHGTSVVKEVESSIALALAQSAAVVYGQVLTDDETTALLKRLFELPSPMRTPDGKLVFTVIEHAAIEKRF